MPDGNPEETQEMDEVEIKKALAQNAKDDATDAAYRHPGRGRQRKEPEKENVEAEADPT